jgi:allophanate hydrolase subunit 1
VDSLQPLGDQAALASCRDERAALRLAAAVHRLAPPWLIDVVQAYTTVAVHFDLDRVAFADVAVVLRGLAPAEEAADDAGLGRRHVLPCCYAMQLDLDRVARLVGLAPEEVVRLYAAA